MSCCGHRRAALAHGPGLRTAPTQAAPQRPARQAGATLVYRGPVPMVLPSPTGGAPYAMERVGQPVEVAAGDARALLNTGWFGTV